MARVNRLGRRDFLKLIAGAGLASVSCRASLPGGGLTAEHVELMLPDLCAAQDGLRVVQISDLHVGRLTPHHLVRGAIDAANRFRPDLIVLTGDYLTHYYGVGKNTHPSLISEQLGGLQAPTIAILGNHDWYVDAGGAVKALESLGYGTLRNQNTTLLLRGEPFTIVGIDDLSTHHTDVPLAMKGARPGSRLYLSHVPDVAERLCYLEQPALVLSGHTHGGQLNVPPLAGIRFRYLAGLYRLGHVQLYVNRGLGNSWMPVRLNAPPEVTLFTLRSGMVRSSPPRAATPTAT